MWGQHICYFELWVEAASQLSNIGEVNACIHLLQRLSEAHAKALPVQVAHAVLSGGHGPSSHNMATLVLAGSWQHRYSGAAQESCMVEGRLLLGGSPAAQRSGLVMLRQSGAVSLCLKESGRQLMGTEQPQVCLLRLLLQSTSWPQHPEATARRSLF